MSFYWESNPPVDLQAIFDRFDFQRLIWFRQSMILTRRPDDDWVRNPPFVCDRDKLRTEIEAQTGSVNQEYLCLDLETPMKHPPDATSHACYLDAMGVATSTKKRSKWLWYEQMHAPFAWKRQGPPLDMWASIIYPQAHVIAPSLYFRNQDDGDPLAKRFDWDVERIISYLNWIAELYPDKEELPFVSVRWKVGQQIIPLDYWTILCQHIVPPNQCLWLSNDDVTSDPAWLIPYLEAMR